MYTANQILKKDGLSLEIFLETFIPIKIRNKFKKESSLF